MTLHFICPVCGYKFSIKGHWAYWKWVFKNPFHFFSWRWTYCEGCGKRHLMSWCAITKEEYNG